MEVKDPAKKMKIKKRSRKAVRLRGGIFFFFLKVMREIKLSSLLEKFGKVSLNKRLDQSGAPHSAASPLKKRKKK